MEIITREKIVKQEVRTLDDAKTTDSGWNLSYIISGTAALVLGALFLIAAISLITGWFSLLQNNWLIVLLELNAGSYGILFDRLHFLNPLDLVIMAFVATMYLGLYGILRRTSKVWSLIAMMQPFLGIVLFIITKTAGRSAVMGAGLVISLVMLRNNIFSKAVAFIGILASLFLLVGDFGTVPNSHSSILALLISIGYVLLIIWFFLIARRLFQLGRE